MGKQIDISEAAYEVGRLSVEIISAIDDLKECGIYKGKLKLAAKQMVIQCTRESNTFFGKNKSAGEVYSRDILLNNKMQGLSASQRIAVSHFIDSLHEIEKES